MGDRMSKINTKSRYDLKMPFDDFVRVERTSRENSDAVIFSCLVGFQESIETYTSELENMIVSLKSASFILIRGELKKDFGNAEIERARLIYFQLAEIERVQGYEDLNAVDFGLLIPRQAHRYQIGMAYFQALECYQRAFPSTNESMRQNLGIKLLMWLKLYGTELFEKTQNKDILSKAIFYGCYKKHEVCFMHFLWQAGCDVICTNPAADPFEGVEAHLVAAQRVVYLNRANELPPIKAVQPEKSPMSETDTVSPSTNSNPGTNGNPGSTTIINTQHPSRPVASNVSSSVTSIAGAPNQVNGTTVATRFDELANAHANVQIDYSCEVLSLLSDSVVMIKVHNEKGEVVSGGSGVVISDRGYILTNLHVVAGGNRFGVYFENDDKEYMTHQIIKYHQAFDIALIQVEREVKALRLSPKALVRGQKVVAIGSPLGLFNTISEGIVSGFRSFEDVDMVQFTAPISNGSSGGALINMQGELVGITTAGFQGQNLNLAVPSAYLKLFAGGFMN